MAQKIKKLRRVVDFRQSKWLGTYIAKNTTKRKKQLAISNNFLQTSVNRLFRMDNGKPSATRYYAIRNHRSASWNLSSASYNQEPKIF